MIFADGLFLSNQSNILDTTAKPLVIINPHSGNKKAHKFVAFLEKNFPRQPYIVTEDREEYKKTLYNNANKFDTFIIAGGDGTINRAIPFFIAHPDKNLAVFPLGSGNGFALELGFSKNFKKLLDDVEKGEKMKIDVIRMNGKYSCNIAGIGLDGYISRLFVNQQSRGLKKYIGLTVNGLRQFTPFQAALENGYQSFEGKYMSMVFANTRQFGNHAFIAPKALPDDGKMTVVLVSEMPFHKIVTFFILLFAGKVDSHSHVKTMHTCTPLRIKTSFSHAHVDGEPFTSSNPVTIDILPKALSIIKPHSRK